MTKVKIEKPLVSEQLAERFEYLRNYFNSNILKVINSCNYIDNRIPEYQRLDNTRLEILLARMFLHSYEVRKPKLKYIRYQPDSRVSFNEQGSYVNREKGNDFYYLSSSQENSEEQTKFTEEEINDFLKDEPKGMWVVEEVEDQ